MEAAAYNATPLQVQNTTVHSTGMKPLIQARVISVEGKEHFSSLLLFGGQVLVTRGNTKTCWKSFLWLASLPDDPSRGRGRSPYIQVVGIEDGNVRREVQLVCAFGDVEGHMVTLDVNFASTDAPRDQKEGRHRSCQC